MTGSADNRGPGSGSVAAVGGEALGLKPVLTLGLGRSGSTLLMELLGTSGAIAFEREYPYERRVLGDLVRRASDEGSDLGSGWVRESGRLVAAYPDAVYYAEKGALRTAAMAAEAGLESRHVVRVRDLRAIWSSILEFDRRRGFYGFGRKEGETEEAYLERFVMIARRVYEDNDALGAAPALWVRYEDLVATPEEVAGRISEWLGVELDWESALDRSGEYRHHRVTDSPEASLLKWQDRIKGAHRRCIEERLGDLMARWGYEV